MFLSFIITYQFFLFFSFFENPNAVHKSRQKGLFDSNKPFCKKLAYGLRSVRKELVNIHPQSAHSQKLTEYVIFLRYILFYIPSCILYICLNFRLERVH